MNIIVMGTGGVGGYYGGLLAGLGHEVTFIARGAHLAAIRANGLQVKSVHGDFTIRPARAAADPAEAGQADLVLLCVKAHDIETAALALRPVVGPRTSILSLQNGVDAPERLGAIIGLEHVLGGATWISSAIEAPGIVRQVSQFRRIVLGEMDGRLTPRLQAVFAALSQTGAQVEMTEDIRRVLWTKLVFISAASALGGLTRLPIGEFRAVPETRAMLTGLMQEVEAVARAQGVALEADVVQKSLAFIDNSGPQLRASMQLDVEAGRPFELESLVGVIGRCGREFGVPTPTADAIYAALLPVDRRARGLTA